MFIELTDHLRCPADHDESFLVLIPDQMNRRQVERGVLGCPVCQQEYRIAEDVVHFSTEPGRMVPEPEGGLVNPGAVAAFLGLEGPGGYVGLIGEAASFAAGLSGLLPGIHLVAVNPPPTVSPSETLSILLSPSLPFKRRSFRGVVLGSPFGADPGWQESALAAVLPGLRAAGHGPTPQFEGFELMAEAEGWWVGRKG